LRSVKWLTFACYCLQILASAENSWITGKNIITQEVARLCVAKIGATGFDVSYVRWAAIPPNHPPQLQPLVNELWQSRQNLAAFPSLLLSVLTTS
jgi:hypothetical protein